MAVDSSAVSGSSIVSDISTALAALAALVAVYIAVKGLRATRHGPIADHLLLAYGEMISALQEITALGSELHNPGTGRRTSRGTLGPAFERFRVASYKVDLIEPPVTKLADYGSWVRVIANNLAANLVQADEDAAFYKKFREDGIDELRPVGLTDAEWKDVSRSDAYLSVLLTGSEIPAERPDGVVELEKWIRPEVMGYGDGTGPDDLNSVYSPHVSYMIQNCRLLDDFVREYLVPWASRSVRHALE